MDPRITNEEVNEDGTVEWQFNGAAISPKIGHVSGALFDKAGSRVYLLSGAQPNTTVLVGLDGLGQELFRTQAPDGFAFMYLTWNISRRPAVVCGATMPSADFMDWHFLIDSASGRLTKSDPAY